MTGEPELFHAGGLFHFGASMDLSGEAILSLRHLSSRVALRTVNRRKCGRIACPCESNDGPIVSVSNSCRRHLTPCQRRAHALIFEAHDPIVGDRHRHGNRASPRSPPSAVPPCPRRG